MQLKKPFNNQKGLSIIELLAVVGIVSLIFLGAATLIFDLQKTFKRAELQQSVEIDNLEIANLLINRAACVNTFQPIGPLNVSPNMPVTSVRDGNGTIRFATPQPFPAPPATPVVYTLTNINIMNYQQPAAVPGSGGRFDVFLTYTFANASVQPNTTTKRLSFVVDVDATHTVVNCYWDRAAEFDDLYINTSGPAETKNGNLTIEGILDVRRNGTAGGFITSEEYYQVSDRRYKTNIKSITEALQKVHQLQGVEFQWKKTGQTDWGLIAQDVEKVAPFLVRTDPETNFKSVNYNSLIALTIEALKELEKNNSKLEVEVQDLEVELKQLLENVCQSQPQYKFCQNGRI